MSERTKELAEKVKSAVKLTDFLEKSKEKNKYCCPFCNSGHGEEGTGAVVYYPASNTAHCFSCNRTFDAIDLLALKKGYSDTRRGDGYIEGVKAGCEYLSISFNGDYKKGRPLEWDAVIEKDGHEPRQSNEETVQDADSTPDKKVISDEVKAPLQADFNEYYKKCCSRLNEPDCPAIAYLYQRGITLSTAKQYQIGYDPASDPLNAPPNSDIKPFYPLPRLIIPYTPYSFTGRAMADCDKKYRYANPKGYSIDIFGKDALTGEQDCIFTVEGALDALSFREVGKASVGLGGHVNYRKLLTAIDELIALNKFKPKKFVICLDVDVDENARANVDVTRKALIEGLQARGCAVVVADICEGRHNIVDGKDVCKDANDFLKTDRAGFFDRLEELSNMAPIENNIPGDQNENKDFIAGYLERIQKETYKPVSTGISWFDRLIGNGFLRRSFCILSASPGSGKTTIALQLAEALARHGQRVIYSCLEMDSDLLLSKVLSARLARWDKHYGATDILQGYNWDDPAREDILKEIERYRANVGDNLILNPDGENLRTVAGLRSYLDKIGKEADEKGESAPFFFLDYLHLVSGDNLEPSEAVKQVCEVLGDYARKHNTVAFTISAVNRGSSSGQIRLDSGRDTSSLEYSADLYLSLNLWLVDQQVVTPNTVVSVPGKPESTYLDVLYLIQNERYRRMIMRVLKGRLSAPGSSAKVYLDAKSSLFLAKEELGADSTAGVNTALPFDRTLPNGARIITASKAVKPPADPATQPDKSDSAEKPVAGKGRNSHRVIVADV